MLSVTNLFSSAQSDPCNKIPCISNPLYLLFPISVANQVSAILISSVAETSSKSLIGIIGAEGVNTTGLKATTAVDPANVIFY